MLLRPLLVLALAAAAACVVTSPKDVKLETSTKDEIKSDELEPAGSSRVGQQQFPEEHVRLQHLSLPQYPHVQRPLQLAQVQPALVAGGQPEQGVQYQYYPVPVPVQVVPVPVVQQQINPTKTQQEHHHTHVHAPAPPQEHVKEHVVHHVPHHHHQPPNFVHAQPHPSGDAHFIPSAGIHSQHDESLVSGGVFGGNPHVHFPEPVDHHHHHPPHAIEPVEHKNQNLKRVLVPLAGIALLGAAAALATNPVLLQLGVVSGKRRRRRSAGVPALTLEDLEEIEDLGPAPGEAGAVQNLTAGVRLKEIAVLQSFLKEQEAGTKRSHGQGDALLSSLLSCSGLLNPRNAACLQRLACEANSPETDLPELEMQVLRIVVKELSSHQAIPIELRKKVRLAVSTGRKGKCENAYRCPAKAWEKCVNPNY